MCEFIVLCAIGGATIYFAGRLGESLGAQRDTKWEQENKVLVQLRDRVAELEAALGTIAAYETIETPQGVTDIINKTIRRAE